MILVSRALHSIQSTPFLLISCRLREVMGKLVRGPLVIWEEGRSQCLRAAVVSLRGSVTPIPGDSPFSLSRRWQMWAPEEFTSAGWGRWRQGVWSGCSQVTKGHSDISSLVGHMGGEGVSRGWQTTLKHTTSRRDKSCLCGETIVRIHGSSWQQPSINMVGPKGAIFTPAQRRHLTMESSVCRHRPQFPLTSHPLRFSANWITQSTSTAYATQNVLLFRHEKSYEKTRYRLLGSGGSLKKGSRDSKFSIWES